MGATCLPLSDSFTSPARVWPGCPEGAEEGLICSQTSVAPLGLTDQRGTVPRGLRPWLNTAAPAGAIGEGVFGKLRPYATWRHTTATGRLIAVVGAILAFGPAAQAADQAKANSSSGDSNAAATGQRPNIVLIMSDDMGYSDIGCYGGEIPTPNLDRLAAGGLRFSQFYNMARCCPTRASLLTGLHPHQAGMGHMTGAPKGNAEAWQGNLSKRAVTIAQVLRPAGYSTYMCGKWHVARAERPDGDKSNWPLQRGFDRFYGTVTGAGSFYDPTTLTRDNAMITSENDPEYRPKRFYYTDAISDNAVRFVEDHAQKNNSKPFFMYVAYTAAHWPMHAPEEVIARYRGRYSAGYEPVRQARFERLRALGLIRQDWPLSPQAGDWAEVEHKDWEQRCMEVYAAMIDCMDDGIGRIVASLQKHDMLENTLILFLQDNGGCAEGLGREDRPEWHLRDLKPMAPDQLQPKIWPPMQTRDGRAVLGGPAVMPGGPDTYIAYGRNWANVSNTPFREYKHWVHEGGISTPLIAHWPSGIRRQGQIEHQPGQVIDLMPTCVELARAAYPSQLDGNEIRPLEGKSLVLAFGGEEIEREALYWEHEGNRAIRVGNWKLVAKDPGGPWELYDIEKDRTEMHDLATHHPGRVRQMVRRWEAWAERAGVLPWVWKPQYRRAKSPAGSSPASRSAPAATNDAKPRTNFLVILCDDLGYGDLACFGHPQVKTPTLDRLAAEGIRFTSCYSAAPVCSPSRAGLLTGRNPNRFGIYDWIPGKHPMHMGAREITIAQLLREAGYATGHFGKWHCNGQFNSPAQPQPGDHGFDHWFSTQNNAGPSHLNPVNFVRNGEPVGDTDGYSCQVVADEAIGWLRTIRPADKPFFAFVCFHETHEPIASPPELAAKYPQAENANQALYFANVTNMDRAVSRLLQTLDELGEAENTLVFFSSDNGPETLNRYGEGSARCYGSPGPLRGMKLHIYDGGIRVPGIIRWPGHTRPGQVVDEPACSLDLLPTFCAIAGIEPPRDRPLDGTSLLPVFENRPVKRSTPLFWFYCLALSKPKLAMRDGDWKLVAHWDVGPGLSGVGPEAIRAVKKARLTDFELYNLREDIGEKRDLAQQQPQRVQAMAGTLRELFSQVQEECPVWPATMKRATSTRPSRP